MRVRTLKTIFALNSIAAIALLGTAGLVMTQGLAVPAVPYEPWSPANPNSSTSVQLDVSQLPFSAALERPLFDPSRRPFVAPPPPPPEDTVAAGLPETSAPDLSTIQLRGLRLSGTGAAALVASLDVPLGTWVAKGDQVFGWTVTGVFKDHIELSFDSQKRQLKLYVDN